jgi:hypothetical protein
MLLTLGAVAIATGMMDAVLLSTVLALIEAVAIMAATAILDGADDLAVRGGEGRIALQVLGCEASEDVTQGGHGRSPCMSELIRA